MKYYLAPMEGLTTYVYRTAFHRHYGGIDKYFTPFLANRRMSSREKNDILPEHNEGLNTVPQILTNRADEFLTLAGELARYGYETVNLNLGCPSGTVVSRNRGAGFLRTPLELEHFLDEIFEKCPLRLSVKTRIGMEEPSEWTPLLALFARYPLEELIIHPRLQREGYSGHPHTDAFLAAAGQLSCPLCYNGDIFSAADLQRLCAASPTTDTVMLGRGVLRNPRLPAQLRGEPAHPSDAARLRAFHDELLERYQKIMSGDTNTLYKMKDLWTFMIESFDTDGSYLKRIKKADRLTEYKLAVDALFRECSLR